MTHDLTITVASEHLEHVWDDYVHAHADGTVDHLWRWSRVITGAFGHRCAYLAASRGPRLAGLLPLVLFHSRIFGRSAVSLPFLNYGGVLADDERTAGALVSKAEEVAREFGASYVELRHRTRQLAGLPSRQHKLGFVRDLPGTADELWSGIDRKVRNQVRKAQKEGLACETGGLELVPAFYDVFATNMRDLGTPVYSRQLFVRTLEQFPGRAQVHVVRVGPRPVAAAVAVRFRDSVIVPWASSLREFRPQCPNMLLYWHMLEQAVRDGLRRFDFGRSSPGAGTHQFKLQWGAREVPLYWEYAVVTQGTPLPDTSAENPSFSRAIAIWKRLPLPVANLLGPWIVRDIP
jgi:FemAB-related protein (PEP-CTERM system-associated)